MKNCGCVNVFLAAACWVGFLVCAGGLGDSADPTAPAATRSAVRFTYVDLYLDSGGHALGAYQLEFTIQSGRVNFVGVEGGQAAAFAGAPYYDPRAMTLNRLILAAYSTGADLPHGKTRIARIHVQVIGGELPRYGAKLTVAADAEGREIPATELSFVPANLEGVAP